MRKKLIFLLTVFALVAILIGCTDLSNGANDYSFIRDYHETVNGVKWTISCRVKQEYNQGVAHDVSIKIEIISSSFFETERTSEYYKQLAYYHGDSTVSAKHEYKLTGTPLGDKDWYKIEKEEKIVSSWDTNHLLKQSTTRHEEKIIFTFLD